MNADTSPDLPITPDLSVIIVNWNVRTLLRGCLESLVSSPSSLAGDASLDAQDRPPSIEIVVVDNASTDGSVEMLQADFPHITLITNSHNRGFTIGNNQGIAAARGRYVMLLNPDTQVLGGALATLVDHMDENPDIGLVGPQLLYPDGGVQSSRRRFPNLATLFLESTWLESLAPSALLRRYYVLDQPDDSVLDVDWVTGAAMLARREAIQQVGGLDESFFMYSEELDWCRRIKAAGWRVVYHPAAKIVHHVGKSSEQAIPARHINFQRSKIRYARKYHGTRTAATLRLFLLGLYAWQLSTEAIKGALGHKPALRRQRVAAYWEVLKSRL